MLHYIGLHNEYLNGFRAKLGRTERLKGKNKKKKRKDSTQLIVCNSLKQIPDLYQSVNTLCCLIHFFSAGSLTFNCMTNLALTSGNFIGYNRYWHTTSTFFFLFYIAFLLQLLWLSQRVLLGQWLTLKRPVFPTHFSLSPQFNPPETQFRGWIRKNPHFWAWPSMV